MPDDIPTPEQKAAARAVLDKPEHKFKPGKDGKDPRNEQTRDDPVKEEA
jgi:hypothetical protein